MFGVGRQEIGKTEARYYEAKERLNGVLDLYTAKKISADELQREVRGAMGFIVNDVMMRVKDELVADFEAVSTFNHLNGLKLRPIPDRDSDANRDIYNYFTSIGFNRVNFRYDQNTREIYDELVAEYNELLEDSVATVSETWDLFDKFGTAKEKKGEFVAFLRQSPLSTWNDRVRLIL